MTDVKKFIVSHQIVHFAEILDQWIKMSDRDIFKILYALFFITTTIKTNAQFENMLKEYHFKIIFSKKFGPKLDCPQKIVMGKITSFLDCIKDQKSSNFDILNSLIGQYHQYRILQLFKFIPEEVVTVCEQISFYLNMKVSEVVLYIHEQKQVWQSANEQQFQYFYRNLSDFRIINRKIEYLKCNLISVKPIKILDQLKFQLIQQRQSHRRMVQEQWKAKQNILEEINNTKTQPKQNLALQQKPILSVKKNLKAMGNAIKKMGIPKS